MPQSLEIDAYKSNEDEVRMKKENSRSNVNETVPKGLLSDQAHQVNTIQHGLEGQIIEVTPSTNSIQKTLYVSKKQMTDTSI